MRKTILKMAEEKELLEKVPEQNAEVPVEQVEQPIEQTEVPTDQPDPIPEETTETPEDNNLGKLKDAVLKFNPEADVSTDEATLNAVVELVGSLVALHDELDSVAEEFPEFGDFIIGLRKGMTPAQAIAAYFDPDSLVPPEDADDYEGFATARDERRKKIDERNAWEEKLPENQELTMKNFSSVSSKLGLDQATQELIVSNLEAILTDAKDGVINPENWEMLANGLRYKTALADKDKEMEAAVEDAKIAGRNEQIEKKRMKKETGDGLPKLSTSGEAQKASKKNELTGLEALANRKSIL